MKKGIITFLLLCTTATVYCQNGKTEVLVFKVRKANRTATVEAKIERIVFVQADVKPAFPGGEQAYNNYIITNLKYPEPEKTKKMQGTVVVSFDVGPMGDISNVKVYRGQTDNMNREALRLISSMPNWKAGYYNGAPAIVEMTLPITFKL